MKNTFYNLSENAASTRARSSSSRASTRGFTLLEVLVTLALMAIMLAIVFVPLNSAFNIFQIGNSRNDLQLASRQTMSQLQSDISKAIYVFPNSTLPGVTDKAPFKNPVAGDPDSPYFGDGATCDNTKRVGNTARLDMLMPLHNDEINPVPPAVDGSVVSPLRPAYYVVTYYARLADPNKGFDAIDNPLQLFRAKMPYKNSDGTDFLVGGDQNITVSNARYNSCGTGTNNSDWLTQNDKNQLNLELYTVDAGGPNPVITGSHTLAMPRDLSLPSMDGGNDLRPRGTSFICADSNGDGKIDRVTVNLTLVRYDTGTVGGSASSANGGGASGQPTYQQNAVTEVIDLPNVR